MTPSVGPNFSLSRYIAVRETMECHSELGLVIRLNLS